MIKLEHTIFALPFAFLGMMLAAEGWPAWPKVGWIVVAMVGARSAAMGFNRLVDRHIDATNPRTAGRELPAGKVSPAFVGTFVVTSSALLVLAAWRLNPLALKLAPLALLIILGYSYTKRVTSWSHLVLGLGLSMPCRIWSSTASVGCTRYRLGSASAEPCGSRRCSTSQCSCLWRCCRPPTDLSWASPIGSASLAAPGYSPIST
jgi:hypothetical protein